MRDMVKRRLYITISLDIYDMLDNIAKEDRRSKSNMIESLVIREFKAKRKVGDQPTR